MSENERFRRDVNTLIHPLVRGELAAFFAAHATAKTVFAEVPLLFESGWPLDDMVDMVIGVRCDPAVRRARLIDCRGWTPELVDRMRKH